MEKQSPIFSKLYDFITWLLQRTDAFPKNERFRLAARLENQSFSLYEQLSRAARSRHPADLLEQADQLLGMLRFYIRLSHDRSLLTLDQYQFAAASLVEIGRLLGGWQKSLITRASAPPEGA